MGIMDSVMQSQGEAQLPYARKGFHLVRLERITVREASGALGAAFKIDARVLATDAEGPDVEYKKGSVIRFQDPFKYPEKTKPLIRRTIFSAKQSLLAAKGERIDEMTLGLKRKEGEKDDEFAKRIGDEAARLVGPDQPLTGAILVINVVTKNNQKTGKPYSLFEVSVPTAEDLKAITAPAA